MCFWWLQDIGIGHTSGSDEDHERRASTSLLRMSMFQNLMRFFCLLSCNNGQPSLIPLSGFPVWAQHIMHESHVTFMCLTVFLSAAHTININGSGGISSALLTTLMVFVTGTASNASMFVTRVSSSVEGSAASISWRGSALINPLVSLLSSRPNPSLGVLLEPNVSMMFLGLKFAVGGIVNPLHIYCFTFPVCKSHLQRRVSLLQEPLIYSLLKAWGATACKLGLWLRSSTGSHVVILCVVFLSTVLPTAPGVDDSAHRIHISIQWFAFKFKPYLNVSSRMCIKKWFHESIESLWLATDYKM